MESDCHSQNLDNILLFIWTHSDLNFILKLQIEKYCEVGMSELFKYLPVKYNKNTGRIMFQIIYSKATSIHLYV